MLSITGRDGGRRATFLPGLQILLSQMKISATVITFNEEQNILAALESLSWADEILLVDSHSTDRTRDIARDFGARLIERDWPGFAEQKQFAADEASNEWIFSLDADERVSDELKESIQIVKQQEKPADGFLVARRSFYQGRWIKGGGWYPDRQLRLFNRARGRWKNRLIHESVEMDQGAKVDMPPGDILHYSVADASHHHRMIGERYAPLGAQQMYADGQRSSALKIATAAPAAFIRSYLLKGGFRDGLAGLTIAGFAAHHAFLKHVLLWEMQNGKNPASDRR
jgi:glycosyltransferase involved in cell wall biosynthesis